MPEDTKATSPEPEPEIIVSTSDGEPAATDVQDATTDHQETQPVTPEEAPVSKEEEARLKRLEANLKGREMELERERREKEQLMQALSRQQTPVVQPQGATVEDEVEEERQYQKALLDSDFTTMGRIRKTQKDRAAKEAEARIVQQMTAASQQANAQGAVQRFMTKHGFTDPNSPVAHEFGERFKAAQNDPEYQAMSGGNPNALAAIILAEVKADRAGEMGKVKEETRKANVDKAFTESGSAGSGARPGAKPAEKIYLTGDEAKYVDYIARKDGVSRAEAARNYWKAMDTDTRKARIAAKAAV